jgi:hypothetical protein
VESQEPLEPAAPTAAQTAPATMSGPGFVVCTARSGSTLLRWLLDSHPEVACPSETEIAELARHCESVAGHLGFPGGPEAAAALARSTVESLMSSYLAGKGKSRWCDKSLSTVEQVNLVARVWPDAGFVFLYRHCMDFIGSALEAEPFGLEAYGFGDFARVHPTNHVAALAAYWHDRTTRMLRAESELPPERRVQVRYEDLVADPDSTLAPVWAMLGVAPHAGTSEAAFSQTHDGIGPADHKIWLTRGVHGESVGRGARIPPGYIPAGLRGPINEQLGSLGYPQLDQNWGCGGPPPPDDGDRTRAELRIVDGHRLLWRTVLDLTAGESLDPDEVPPAPVVVALERRVIPELVGDRGALPPATRRRDVRWYGLPAGSYDAERLYFDNLIELLAAHGEYLWKLTDPTPAGN